MLGWELPPHNSGGLGVACLHLSRALASRGAEIDFVVPYSAAHEQAGHMNVLSALPIHHDKNTATRALTKVVTTAIPAHYAQHSSATLTT